MLLSDLTVVGRMIDKVILVEMIELREIRSLLEVALQEPFSKRHLNVIKYKGAILLSLLELNVLSEKMEQLYSVLIDLKDQLNLNE
jgi:hypothetical protein